MNCEKIYKKKYDETFLKTEKEVKSYFLNEKKNDKSNINVNTTFDKINNDINNLEIHQNLKLRNLINIFKNTKHSYNKNGIKRSFENEVLENFNEIAKNELPEKYNYNLFVENLAEHDALYEIVRLLQNCSFYYQLLYEFDKLDFFKIEKLEMHELEETKLYKELHKLKYPNGYILKVTMPIDEKPIDEKGFSTTEKVLLIEKALINLKWGELSDRKRSILISKIIDRNDTNIRNILMASSKKPSKNTDEFNNKVESVNAFFKQFN